MHSEATPIVRGLWRQADGKKALAIRMPGLVIGTAWSEGDTWHWRLEAGGTAFGREADSWEEARDSVEQGIMAMLQAKEIVWEAGWT